MARQSFSLIPFTIQGTPDLTINGHVSRHSNTFYIRYVLAGHIRSVALPALNAVVSRKHELWRTTCFEFFLAIKNKTQYWELNMSPSGDWNIYVMDSYRQVGMREEMRITRLPFEFQKEANNVLLKVTINLDPIIAREEPLEVGVASVIQAVDGKQTYWALVHPYYEADFHAREGFILGFE